MSSRIRVFMVDDHAVVRRGMAAFLEMLDDIDLIGDADCGAAAIEAVIALTASVATPDVVLMDLNMPEMDGVETTRRLLRISPSIKVIAVTSFGDVERVRAALSAGAAGYVLKDADVDEIAAAIRAAHRGEIHLDAALTRELAMPKANAPRALTPRERDVIALVAQGKSNKDIAGALVISERTARTHVSNVLSKLGLSSRTQAALWAAERGL